ncbi:hypothetical protein LB579_31260 [Mesorhizobium sp. BR1-1-7]|uniref:hypothetical protein n=1 Tax=Mesorhizobium sp. BR1-1-7 TaxID=2876647 RepID=UPI001CCD3789|nr:hypothetical protein [Mesorhizobium sp. BR1-1-7]MBZ9922165.1 hypothetical protein [Mesorhizobium sp. BR1-1-7]
MTYLVTIETYNQARSATVEVFANNKEDAAYRAAEKIENTWNVSTGRVIACRKSGAR